MVRSQWINIDDQSTYLHGPFEFATINGRKTLDRISTKDWTRLEAQQDKYDNKINNSKHNESHACFINTQYHESYSDDDASNEMHALLGRSIYFDEPLF